MELIRLTKTEKQVLRALCDGTKLPDRCRFAVYSLQDKELIHAARIEGGDFEDFRLTTYGRYYLRQNTNLRNPLFSDENLLLIAVIVLSAITIALSLKLILKAL